MTSAGVYKRYYMDYEVEPYARLLELGELAAGDVDDNLLYEAELLLDKQLEEKGAQRRFVVDEDTYLGQVPQVFYSRQYGRKQVKLLMNLYYTLLGFTVFVALIAYSAYQINYWDTILQGLVLSTLTLFLSLFCLTPYTYDVVNTVVLQSSKSDGKTNSFSISLPSSTRELTSDEMAELLFPRDEIDYWNEEGDY